MPSIDWWLFPRVLSMSFEELVFCLALGPDTDTHHSLWSEDWNVVMFLCQTQTVGCGAYMTRMRHHTKHEPAYYHVYTSCSCLCPGSCLHFTKSAWNPFKLRAQNAVIWKYDLVFTEMNASRYLLISISHDSKNEKYPRISNFWCWQVTCHQSESVKYYTSPESSDICSLQQPSQSSVSWSRNIRQLFGRKYLTILIAYLALLTVQCEGPLGSEGALSPLKWWATRAPRQGLNTPTSIVTGCCLYIQETRQRQAFSKPFHQC